ncbi:ubiquinone biosynthesis accessory factor UbiJ [Cellvibrio fibrivorans]|uniref:Ubiquinone biosynthesis accessory factor UbiJ n=1 Tax=Cellvibrio fibrivorans TaxID=126350 RepID=A0ABU1UUW5_9GAMM|nr:SCP2 sterol-binding domain-containing protein [Cellvibrio fibrivorans]MDR7088980.1 ubiquinone biosynthesis protein UbiJ [Cellvibrio fibrivorans]
MANTLTIAALASAEKMLNAALRYDPATRIGLAQLEGKILAVQITAPALQFFIMPMDDELRLMGNWDGDVDTRITGSLLALAQLSQTEIHNLKGSGVTVMGDLSLLADLQRLVKNLDIDWEEMLSQFTGDIVGHQAAQLIRAKLGWAKDSAKNAQRLTGEFLTEELKILPGKHELEDFYRQVDDLRLAVDRAAARVETIINRKNIKEKSNP